ncbi:hypothetical protein G5B30_08390 [Sphingobacterium sp. SGG-5]|uniref:hypothetical protein n=1 Tax=Sphingobacterium sp. SGG-5 TaxID=2710881 RepID=UPI0013E9B0D2|nr:hypothetical protein [Sphingobacterium sp. SGG-5]NGM61933.1 hypothetical protein [Sphingobacterium sp. SGG-5]
MKSSTVSQLKKELGQYSTDELIAFCLRLAKFKKENKELLTYLLFEADDENAYIEGVKREMIIQFETINNKNYYWMRKSIRKILKEVKKYIRYSQKKETEVELLLAFCLQLHTLSPSIRRDKTLQNLLDRQLAMVRKTINALHEDLQFDFNQQLEALTK